MKEEAAGTIIREFVRLRPMMYSFVIAQSKTGGTIETVNKHRAKGIQRAVADMFIHQKYKQQLEHPEENYVANRRLGSRLQRIYGIEVLVQPMSLLDRILHSTVPPMTRHSHLSVPKVVSFRGRRERFVPSSISASPWRTRSAPWRLGIATSQ